MRTNANITIYNRYLVGKVETYLRTEIRAVAWESTQAVKKLANGGVISDNKAIIYIPFQRGSAFLSPRKWQALATVDKPDSWTLQEGDIIVKGIISDELTVSYTPTDLKAEYDDVYSINAVDPFSGGSLSLQHWAVGVK